MRLKALYQEYVVSLNAKTEQDLRNSFNFSFSDEKTRVRQMKRLARDTELNGNKAR